jgi:formiminotetrahydrofolate cyclodeaminase
MVVELTAGRPDAADHEALLDDVARPRSAFARSFSILPRPTPRPTTAVVRARRLPRETEAEVEARTNAMTEATRHATRTPLATAAAAAAVLELADRIAPIGNRNAISDVGVGAMLAAAAVRGAALNVRINVPYLAEDDPLAADASAELDRLLARADEGERRIAAIVADRMG